MNTMILANKDSITFLESEKETKVKRIQKNKYIVLVADEGYDYIDELVKQLELIEEAIEGRQRYIAIIGDLSQERRNLLRAIYKNFTFLFIEFE
jgi:hypothetical protein